MITRLLNINDLNEVLKLDRLSGKSLAKKLNDLGKEVEDLENSLYGIFSNNTLIGYCSLSYADGIVFQSENPDKKEIGVDDLYLNDVFILNNYRHIGCGSKMIKDAITNKIYKGSTVYLNILSLNLLDFYEPIGFILINDSGLMRKVS